MKRAIVVLGLVLLSACGSAEPSTEKNAVPAQVEEADLVACETIPQCKQRCDYWNGGRNSGIQSSPTMIAEGARCNRTEVDAKYPSTWPAAEIPQPQPTSSVNHGGI